MPQVTHFNEETLVKYLRIMMRVLRQQDIDSIAPLEGGTIDIAALQRELDQQFPEISKKDKRFLEVIRATQPELLTQAKMLVLTDAKTPVPRELVAVNNAYVTYCATLTNWGI